jgi:hypothetical protein
LMASALAKIFQDDHYTETLILCPKNLVKMWEDYVAEYRLLAKVLSVTRAQRELPELRRYRVVLIDESQNLRNREGKRYRAIQEYIQENESKCILLSATPYNKTYLDLSSQLRLFVAEDKDLGIRPERLLRELGETEFIRRHQSPVRSLAAFEKSDMGLTATTVEIRSGKVSDLVAEHLESSATDRSHVQDATMPRVWRSMPGSVATCGRGARFAGHGSTRAAAFARL